MSIDNNGKNWYPVDWHLIGANPDSNQVLVTFKAYFGKKWQVETLTKLFSVDNFPKPGEAWNITIERAERA